MVLLRVTLAATATAPSREVVLRFFNPAGRGVVTQVDPLPTEPLQTLDEGAQRIVIGPAARAGAPGGDPEAAGAARRVPGSAIPPGEFIEYDYDEEGSFAR